jgi:hypothetical protein
VLFAGPVFAVSFSIRSVFFRCCPVKIFDSVVPRVPIFVGDMRLVWRAFPNKRFSNKSMNKKAPFSINRTLSAASASGQSYAAVSLFGFCRGYNVNPSDPTKI